MEARGCLGYFLQSPNLVYYYCYMCTYAWCVVSGSKGNRFGVCVLQHLCMDSGDQSLAVPLTHSASSPALALKSSLSLNLELRDPLVSEPPVLGNVYRLEMP